MTRGNCLFTGGPCPVSSCPAFREPAIAAGETRATVSMLVGIAPGGRNAFLFDGEPREAGVEVRDDEALLVDVELFFGPGSSFAGPDHAELAERLRTRARRPTA